MGGSLDLFYIDYPLSRILIQFVSILLEKPKKVSEKFANHKTIYHICNVKNKNTNQLKYLEGKTMKTQNTYNKEKCERNNRRNDDAQNMSVDSSIWYN